MKGIKNMEINKQLFEDVLSGKLKGTFVLRNGDKVESHKLLIDTNAYAYPIVLRGGCYTYQGEFNLLSNSPLDIIDFIPDTIEIDPEMYSYNEKDIQFIEHFINGHHMKENELTIEIPDGKIVDWDESKKQNKIVLKDKQLTYKDVCKKLFEKRMYFIDKYGTICSWGPANVTDPNNAPTEHQLECILAKNKLANVATYLNDGWKPDFSDNLRVFVIYNENNTLKVDNENSLYAKDTGHIIFKSQKLAKQAIEILGEETIKLSLEPLGV